MRSGSAPNPVATRLHSASLNGTTWPDRCRRPYFHSIDSRRSLLCPPGASDPSVAAIKSLLRPPGTGGGGGSLHARCR